MSANVIMFTQPVLKVYQKLPPPIDELSEVLAFVFIGSCAPTPEDFARTPMLVRRHKVSAALEWLKLNHGGYSDLEISEEDLASYPENGIPVVVDFKKIDPDNNNAFLPPAQSVHDSGTEQGTSEGPCTFAVHGLTGAQYETASIEQLKMIALRHLTEEGKLLGIGRSEDPVSMYDSLEAYPGMFPWLFPYGLGGVGHPSHHKKISDMTSKKLLLMYNDK
ncbi:hypothetical protein B0H10DRAFT_1687704, partial [Mycena sp. CBHHK59/15]